MPIRDLGDIAEAFIRIVEHAVLFTRRVKELHQLRIVRAVDLVGVAVLPAVPIGQPRKMPIQRTVVVFPIAASERHARAEADDALHARVKAVIEDGSDIFPRVGQKRQEASVRASVEAFLDLAEEAAIAAQ